MYHGAYYAVGDVTNEKFMPLLIASFITTVLVALIATPLVIRFANRWGLVDDPEKRYHPAHTHSGIIPRAGGLAIFIALAIGILLYVELQPSIIAIIVSAFLIVLIGLWDDYKDLSPYVRLMLNFLIALVVVMSGVGISFITNPFGGVIHLDRFIWTVTLFGQSHELVVLSVLFSLIWIVWMMNAVGWSAGVDGQFPGFVAIASFVIALLSQRFAQLDQSEYIVTELALITAGAFLGFLFWNFYPQKIMPGYGGKSLAGFILAVVSLLSGAKVGTALLVLGIPLIDAFYTVTRRILQGKSPFLADRGHLHHRLLDLGWGKRRIAFFYWGITALLGSVALTFQSPGKLFVFLFLFVVFGVVLVSLRFFNFFRVRS